MRPPPTTHDEISRLMDEGQRQNVGASFLPFGDDSMVARVFRSRTMEEFDSLIAENDDLLFDLVGLLPPEVSLGWQR